MKPNNLHYPHILEIEKARPAACGDSSIVQTRSPVTDKINIQVIPVSLNEVIAWINGKEHIQKALPKLNDAQRELLISGCTSEDWDILFGKTEE
jgi:hypothetical protein